MVRGLPKPDFDMFKKLGIKADMQAHFIEEVETVQVVFEENWLALTVFIAVQTQWRIVAGMSGSMVTGLDYAALKGAMDMLGVSKKKRPQLFDDVRILEAAWLETYTEDKRKDKQ